LRRLSRRWPEGGRREKATLIVEVNHLRAEIRERGGAMKKMTDEMAKAQKTVKVQSDLRELGVAVKDNTSD